MICPWKTTLIILRRKKENRTVQCRLWNGIRMSLRQKVRPNLHHPDFWAAIQARSRVEAAELTTSLRTPKSQSRQKSQQQQARHTWRSDNQWNNWWSWVRSNVVISARVVWFVIQSPFEQINALSNSRCSRCFQECDIICDDQCPKLTRFDRRFNAKEVLVSCWVVGILVQWLGAFCVTLSLMETFGSTL